MNTKIVCAVIKRKKTKKTLEFLLVKTNRKFGKFTGFLQPVGGHVEDLENYAEALTREVREELGVSGKSGKMITTAALDIPNSTAYWLHFELTTGELKPNKEEVVKVEWLTLEEMDKRRDIWPATKDFFTHYLREHAEHLE